MHRLIQSHNSPVIVCLTKFLIREAKLLTVINQLSPVSFPFLGVTPSWNHLNHLMTVLLNHLGNASLLFLKLESLKSLLLILSRRHFLRLFAPQVLLSNILKRIGIVEPLPIWFLRLQLR